MLRSHIFWIYTLSKHLSLEKQHSQVFFEVYRPKGIKSPESWAGEHTAFSWLLRSLFGICNPKAWTLKSFSWAKSLGTATPSHLVYGRLNEKQEELCQKHASLGASTLRAFRHPIATAIPPNQGDAGSLEARVPRRPQFSWQKNTENWQELPLFCAT